MNLSPKEIVKELDKYIIGQDTAKRAVAIALRNRYRRSCLDEEIRDEITPKNIIMKGPTGVGKTEIARRLAKLVKAPFVKVEATKYTEVGYVGRDVESMVRDLVSVSVRIVKEEKQKEVESKATKIVDEKIIKAIHKNEQEEAKKTNPDAVVTEESVKERYFNSEYDNKQIEIELIEAPKQVDVVAGMGEIDLNGMIQGFFPQKRKKRKLIVKEAKNFLIQEESEKLIDKDSVNLEAIKRAENEGIIFIDEMDKIIGKGTGRNGPDVSREGVQRDILPIVEGCTIATKYGNIRTDFILFIAAGAFHISKIEDMIPELQGRFPIRVELNNLSKNDFIQILTEPKNAIIKQYEQLLSVDNIKLEFTNDAIDEIAEIAYTENETSENIGARRLHTIMETLLEDISFNASGEHPMLEVKIDRKYVQKALLSVKNKYDLKKYVL